MGGELWFRNQLVAMGYGDRTVYEYIRAMQRISDHVDLDHCTALELKAAVEQTIPFTWSSRKGTHSALQAYWTATGRDDAPIKAIRIPRKPRFQCRARSVSEARRLAATAECWVTGGEGLAVLFGLFAALRRHEIAAMKWEDLTDDGWLRVTGKYDQPDEVPLNRAIVEKLDWWRGFEVEDPTDGRTRPGEHYIFAGHRGRPHVTPATVWEWTRKVACKAGIADLTTHELRHTALATINDMTKDLRVTQQIARHQDPSTTVLYTRVTRSRMKGAVDGLRY